MNEKVEQARQNKPLKKQTVRNAEYYQMIEIMDELYRKSKDGNIFYSLMGIITSENNILMAFRNIKTNKGSDTPGINEETIKTIEKIDKDELIEAVREKLREYEPDPVRRVEIPKPGSDKKRPLGIPSILDRIIQQCIKQVLEPILEAKFYDHSYGFRPDRSVEHAMHRTYYLANISGLHYVVDVDIKGFFDNVNHNKLKRQLWTAGMRDQKLLSIISAMLKAPIIMPDGSKVYPDKGTPQGGIISPLLANLVLNELDWWVSSQWENFPAQTLKNKEYSSRSSKYQSLRENTNLKEMYIVRYADDFKIFARSREEAERILIAVKDWLKERLKLETSPEKSGITNLRKSNTEFLGFRIKLRKKSGKYVVVSHMSKKAIKKVKTNLKTQIKKIQKAGSLEERIQEINKYNAMVMGYHEYYGLATNINSDLHEINQSIRITLYNRLLKEVKNPKKGELNPKSAIAQKYGESKQIRFVNDLPLVPIAYCKTSPPMGNDKSLSRFTPKGRDKIHKRLGVNLVELHRLMGKRIFPSQTVEFVDNRISVYCAQYGKCAVTGIELTADQIHCHHILPKFIRGPDDSYDNLVIVHPIVHILIHARKVDTVMKYLPILNGDKKAIKRLNKYRVLAGNFELSNVCGNSIQLSFFDQF